MVRLTEEMVIARARTSDMASIRKLNCWGVDLTDISLLRRMQNVEVLSLSVNKITSLADFQYCKNLKELYVRKNNIKNLNEVYYLKTLPCLRHLWLAENPCAAPEWYRLAVLKTLPNLERLDDVVVQPEEVQDALRVGLDLVHPEDCEDSETPIASYSPPPQNTMPPVSRSPPNRRVSVPQGEPDDATYAGEVKYQSSRHPSSRKHSDVMRDPPARRPSDVHCDRSPPNRRVPVPQEDLDNDISYIVDSKYSPIQQSSGWKQNEVHDEPPTRRPTVLHYEPVHNSSNSSENGAMNASGGGLCGKCSSPLRHSAVASPVELSNTTNATNCVVPSAFLHYLSNGDRLSPEREGEITPENCDRHYRQWWHDMESEVMNPSRFPRKKSYPKNAEVLFSILSLMNHVDYPGLALLSAAVRRRMQEFEN